MFREIEIENFRSFREFRLTQLGRVNLLVGTNNSGKTSILEAIELLAAPSDLRNLWRALNRRGENIWPEEERRTNEMDASHLFHGHHFGVGQRFSIFGRNNRSIDRLVFSIGEGKQKDPSQQQRLFEDPEEEFPGRYSLDVEHVSNEDVTRIRLPISARGGLSSSSINTVTPSRAQQRIVRFIGTAALSTHQVVSLFDEVVLTREEELVIEALQTIEPDVERIAPVATEQRRSSSLRGGIVVKCRGIADRIPIGSLGDGIWRMIGLSLALVSAENGVLLVDEIDTGLHYSVMSDMWKLVRETSKRLNVQVFATTHSRDCYESLAEISRKSKTCESDVTIQRLERGKREAIAFTEREIVIAAERGIEVR